MPQNLPYTISSRSISSNEAEKPGHVGNISMHAVTSQTAVQILTIHSIHMLLRTSNRNRQYS
jgi:hypothetical protein